MNILMVDDDTLFLEKLQETVHFKDIGIEMVFTAGNIRQAMDIMNKYPVDIVLSDIEMPQGSGLELLQWIREKEFFVECIFLSSYAYFAYAQKAIALNSSEYLLKPVSEGDLEKTLKNVIEKIKKEKGEVRLDQEEESFWTALVLGNDKELRGEERKEIYSIYWLKCMKVSQEEKQYLSYYMEHFGDLEMEQEQHHPAAVIALEENNWLMIFEAAKNSVNEKERATNVRQRVCEQTKSWFYLFGAQMVPVNEVKAIKDQLEQLAKEAICTREGILFLHQWERKKQGIFSPSWDIWETSGVHVEMMPKTKENILTYLSTFAQKGKLTVELLCTFRKELMQLMYNCLKRQNVAVTSIFGDEEFDKYYERSVYMLEYMEEFIVYLFDKLCGYHSKDNRQEIVVREICQYIEEHLEEEITRKQLAALVFLSEDYVSKLFSATMGVTLPTYIMRCRMESAKKYLRGTSLSISQVAMQTGYSNFSYFSKNFRDYTGVTPNEYREQKK